MPDLANLFTDEQKLGMPEKFQSGSVLIDNGDLVLYLQVFISSIAVWSLYFLILRKIYARNNYFDEKLANSSNDLKYTKVAGIVTMTHHGLVPFIITYTLYNSCSNEQGWPWPSELGGTFSTPSDPKTWGFFRSDECFFEVNKGFVMIMLFTIGFLSYDVVGMFLCIEDQKNRLVKQTFWHHYAAIIGFFTTLITGYSYPGLGCFSLYSEISSVFLIINDQLKHKPNSKLLAVSQIIFVLTYTVFRMIFFPWILYQMCRTLYFFINQVSLIRAIGMLICCSQAVLILALNIFWYKIIIKKLIKMIVHKEVQSNDLYEKTAKEAQENTEEQA